ncbi:hypothetical protein LEP1GSC038_2289 [Leptospira weilii str. 2006001855]|uniref:Uncharacterized protein n=1 Tax=Leptospira weilii str. 2006001855 TaxID=996804 RepID=M6FMH0_9LEPT|nr:hypothetical protein LEP1GSC038_2289 [Leptospira weilii str. 2006001855]
MLFDGRTQGFLHDLELEIFYRQIVCLHIGRRQRQSEDERFGPTRGSPVYMTFAAISEFEKIPPGST